MLRWGSDGAGADLWRRADAREANPGNPGRPARPTSEPVPVTFLPRPRADRGQQAERREGGPVPDPGRPPLEGTQRLEPVGQRVELERLRAFYGHNEAVKGVDLEFAPNKVSAMIGPSGCGKSTLVRCINRMHEEIPGARAEGRVLVDGLDVYGEDIDVVAVRRAVGMVFQRPSPFPAMSIFDNVAAGLRLSGRKEDLKQVVERSLRGAGLWDEVKDRLSEPGLGLSGGQQQRLCIARAIAVEPEVIVMDEPCSALDPVATLRIEELMDELKTRYTIILVTHNMQQAARVADFTAFMLGGELVEFGATEKIFTNPDDARTEDYVSGKFG